MVAGAPADEPSRTRRSRAVRLAPFALGSVAGVVLGFRMLSFWESGSHERVPTGGLVYLGAVIVTGGLLGFHPDASRFRGDDVVKPWRWSWGHRPGGDSDRGSTVFAVRDWLVAREERQRELLDRPAYRYRTAMTLVSAGATVIVCALLR